ncbi:MAG: amidohydrolase [Ezakiella sp.]|nr:amidohydrolase [Ezakiella sp.]
MDIIDTRRYFHQFPETSFNEFRTTKEIINILKDYDCHLTYGKALYGDHPVGYDDIDAGYTGVLATFSGENPYILIRSDIDGLPIEEAQSDHYPAKNNFRSKSNMHACGHDGHIALLLSLAIYINKIKPHRGIKLLFQPAEEDVRGAMSLDESLLENVNLVIGYHIGLGEAPRTIGVGSTNFLATKKLKIDFIGKASHCASAPELGISALDMAISFINKINSVIDDLDDKFIFNVGKISGGEAVNIIMPKCTIAVDARASSNHGMDLFMKNINDALSEIERDFKARTALEVMGSAESYKEDDDKLVDDIISLLNKNDIKTSRTPDFGASEDVTKYMNMVKARGGKAIHLKLGSKLSAPHHNDHFDFEDEDLLLFDKTIKLILNDFIDDKL